MKALSHSTIQRLLAVLVGGLGLSLAGAPCAQAAGTVQVRVVLSMAQGIPENDLIIEGDSQSNCIFLNGSGGIGEYDVKDCDGSTVIKCKVQQAECVEDVSMGSDNVRVTSANDDFKIDMGSAGDDTVILDDGDESTVRDDLDIETHSGNDTVRVQQFAVLDNMTISTESGNDLVHIGGNLVIFEEGTDGVAVHDKTEIDTGSGTDCTVLGDLSPATATDCPTSP